jgi:aspartokinase-like uncharacterized kinase
MRRKRLARLLLPYKIRKHKDKTEDSWQMPADIRQNAPVWVRS